MERLEVVRGKMKTKKAIRICLWFITIVVIVCLALMLVCNQIVVNNAKGKVFSEIDSIRYNKVGLLLGTTPQARFDRITNYFFIYRIDAAEQLYKAGKIEKILISGDENSLDGVNETECMRDSLVARGVPASDIILDGKGYRTICSVVNANKVFGLKSFTIISQKFHNERAIYQAEHLGLDLENLQAYNAKMPTSRRAFLTTIREYFARVKMFMDLLCTENNEKD
jgi:SanA protein